MRLLTAAALVLGATPVLGDVLNPGIVDGRARVLIHLDMLALTETTLFKLAYEELAVDIDAALLEFEEETGLDPLRDLRSVTVYSNDIEKDHWVALLRANERLDAAFERLQRKPGYAEVTHGARTLHSITEGDQQWFGYLYDSRPAGERLFVISEGVDALVAAIDVIEGKRENLAQVEQAAVESAPRPGATLFVSADRGLGSFGDFAPSSEVSQLVTGVLFECGEAEEVLFARLRLTAASEKDARDIRDIIQGGLAIASLIAGRAEGAEVLDEFVRALEVEQERKVVTVDFEYSSRRLWNGLEDLGELVGIDRR